MTEVARVSVPVPMTSDLPHSTPNGFLRDLETLVSNLEDSFAGSEAALATKASPRAAAKLQVEKERRMKLISKISEVLHAPGTSTSGLMEGASDASEEMSLSSLRSAADGIDGEGEGGADWKRNTLMRLRKFLKKKYRQKKSRLIDSASKAGCTAEWMASEKSQIVQIAADIRSIEFEIRLLSGAKTVQQVGRQGEQVLSDASHRRVLSSGGGSAERAQGDVVGEEEARGLSVVKRQLLDCYEDHPHREHESVVAAGASAGDNRATAVAGSATIDDADSSSEPLSSEAPRHMAKIERPGLRSVKRNLLNAYNVSSSPLEVNSSSEASIGSSGSSSRIGGRHQSSALLQGGASRVLGGASASAHVAARGHKRQPLVAQQQQQQQSQHQHHPMDREVQPDDSPMSDGRSMSCLSSSGHEVHQWTDVDLGRWATVSKLANMSPVAVRTTSASPMPVVLQHRIISDHSAHAQLVDDAGPGGEEEVVLDESGALEEEGASLQMLDAAAIDSSLSSGARDELINDLNDLSDDFLATQSAFLAPAPPLNLAALPSMPEETDAGAAFDSSVALEAHDSDHRLLALLTRILRGPGHHSVAPLTSRYHGNDPDLQLAAGVALAEGEDAASILAEACMRELPGGGACEGRNLMLEFEEINLHETVMHTSSEFAAKQGLRLGDASKEADAALSVNAVAAKLDGEATKLSGETTKENGEASREEETEAAAAYAYVSSATPDGEPSEPCNRALAFVTEDGDRASPDACDDDDDGGDAAPGGGQGLRRSQEVAKRLDFGASDRHMISGEGGGSSVPDPRLPSDSVGERGGGAAARVHDESGDSFEALEGGADDSFEALEEEAERVAAVCRDEGGAHLRVEPIASSPKLCISSEASRDGDNSSGGIIDDLNPVVTSLEQAACSRSSTSVAANNIVVGGKPNPAPYQSRRSSPPTTTGKSTPTRSTWRSQGSNAKNTPSPKAANTSGSGGSSSRPVNRPTTPTPHRRPPFRPSTADSHQKASPSASAKPGQASSSKSPGQASSSKSPGQASSSRSSSSKSPPTPRAASASQQASATTKSPSSAAKSPGAWAAPSIQYTNSAEDAKLHSSPPPRAPVAASLQHQPLSGSRPSSSLSARLLELSEPRRTAPVSVSAASLDASHSQSSLSNYGVASRASLAAASDAPKGGGAGGALGNKIDLVSSLRMARKGTGGHGPSQSSSGMRRVHVQDRIRTLRPLPPSLSSTSPEAPSGLASSSATAAANPSPESLPTSVPTSISSGTIATVGGKRVSAPRVYGAGVASLQPCAPPPDEAMLDALRLAAADKLAAYRRRVAQSPLSSSAAAASDEVHDACV